jgi:hypothetical protein
LSRQLRSETRLENQQKILSQYFEKCGEPKARDDNGQVELIIQASSIAYQPETIRGVYRVTFRERSGRQVEGLLGMKASPLPRPLVIVKCGLQCGLGSASLLQAMMFLFDEGPFHVLLLPSTSSEEVQLQTGNIVVGGFDEGRQILDIAKILQSSQFSESTLISSVHVLGLSLGGHAALFAALYASFDPRPDGQFWIQSTSLACPVVDLRDSVESLYSPTLLGTFAFDKFWTQFANLLNRIPLLGEVLGAGGEARLRDVPNILAKTSVRYFQKMQSQPSWSRAPFEDVVIQSEEDFWHYNDFSRFAPMLKTDVFLWAARDDIVVLTEKNSERLVGSRGGSRGRVHGLITNRGNHCAFAGAYGWKIASTVLRSLILSQASLRSDQVHRVLVPELSRWGVFKPETRGFRFEARRDGWVDLKVLEFDRACAEASCQRVRSRALPLERFGLDRGHWPLNQAEQELLTRRLNAAVDFWPVNQRVWKWGDGIGEFEWTSFYPMEALGPSN